GLLAAGLVPRQSVFAADVRSERLDELERQYGIQVVRDNHSLVGRAGVIILAVKPQTMTAVLEEIAPGVTEHKLVISIAAGVPTVLGAARLLLETGVHPGQLEDMVASPGGTTMAGVAALEDGGVRRAFITAVERATQRSRELGRGRQ